MAGETPPQAPSYTVDSGVLNSLSSFASLLNSSDSGNVTGVDSLLYEQLKDLLVVSERFYIAEFQSEQTLIMKALENLTGVVAYFDQPQIIIASSGLLSVNGNGMLEYNMDIFESNPRIIVDPGEIPSSSIAFNFLLGLVENNIEGNIMQPGTDASNNNVLYPVYTQAIFQSAQAQGIALIGLYPGDESKLDQMPFSADVKALISDELESGKSVIIPTQPVIINDSPRIGWFEIDPSTGTTTGVLEDGTHGATEDYATTLLYAFL